MNNFAAENRWILSLCASIFVGLTLAESTYVQAQEKPFEQKGVEASAPPLREDTDAQFSQILSAWEKNHGSKRTALPRRWLFLQDQAGVYGSPSPLSVDRVSFESYGWLRLAESDAIRLFIQMNPKQKNDAIKPEDLSARLKRYAELTQADGVLLKMRPSSEEESSGWALYAPTRNIGAPAFTFVKGPESFRGDTPVSWLVSQLNYDAIVVGIEDDYLVLAKLKPLKRGAQGLILKKSASTLVADAEKEVGALLRIVYDSEDYVLAKVSLSKTGRPNVPIGSKVLFDQP